MPRGATRAGGTLTQNEPIVDVRDLYYAYPPLRPEGPQVEALKGVTFSLSPGEFAVIMGPSGAGKSTLCLALCGIVPHSTGGVFGGTVRILGRDTRHTRPPELSAVVGTVFQDPESQLFTTVVEDEVAFGLESQGLPPAEIDERVDWALARVGMREHRLRNPAFLSGGQKQRIAIAAAIATQPALLVLDEPTASLDPLGSAEVAEVLASLRRDLAATVVMVTQDAELAMDFADRIILLHDGVIALDGSPAWILDQPSALAAHGLHPPVVCELAAELRQRGCEVSFRTVVEAEQALRTVLLQKDSCRPW